MMNYNTLLAVASWEDRFMLGIKQFLIENTIQQIILFDYIEYAENTKNNTYNLTEHLEQRNIKCIIIQLKHNNSIDNWKIVTDTINKITGSLIIDISTMPRDIIYFSLFHAEKSDKINKLCCLYNCPEKYSDDNWLTRDPCKPQLIYNMSGIFEMGKDTILIILTGFDRKRIEQLLNYYEPQKVYIGVQTGEKYQSNVKNAGQYIDNFRSHLQIERFDLDSYSKENFGFNEIEEKINENADSNIIVASLGPKPSSIALFRLNKKYPNIGLIHVPVATYNINYSFGIDCDKTLFEQIK